MKTAKQFSVMLAIMLIIGSAIFVYFRFGDLLGLGRDPVEQMHAMLDDNIDLVLSPLSPFGNEDALPGIAELKFKIIALHNATPPLNEDVYRQALQVCDLLVIAATERNAYIKRLEQNRAATKPLLIAKDRQPASHSSVHASSGVTGEPISQPTPQKHVPRDKDNDEAQKQDVEERIKHNEHATIQQWNEKAAPYRNMIRMRYPDFSLVVK